MAVSFQCMTKSTTIKKKKKKNTWKMLDFQFIISKSTDKGKEPRIYFAYPCKNCPSELPNNYYGEIWLYRNITLINE